MMIGIGAPNYYDIYKPCTQGKGTEELGTGEAERNTSLPDEDWSPVCQRRANIPAVIPALYL